MKRFTFIILGIALVVFLAYSFKPIETTTSQNCIKISGKVVSLKAQDNNQIEVRLENDSHYYQLQGNVNLQQLSTKVLNKTVTLYCPNRWTLTSPDGIVPKVSRMDKGTTIVYNDMP